MVESVDKCDVHWILANEVVYGQHINDTWTHVTVVSNTTVHGYIKSKHLVSLQNVEKHDATGLRGGSTHTAHRMVEDEFPLEPTPHDGFASLPQNTIANIHHHLDYYQIVNLGKVNKNLGAFLKSEHGQQFLRDKFFEIKIHKAIYKIIKNQIKSDLTYGFYHTFPEEITDGKDPIAFVKEFLSVNFARIRKGIEDVVRNIEKNYPEGVNLDDAGNLHTEVMSTMFGYRVLTILAAFGTSRDWVY
tara:strand:+ start:2200 stop:2934 length:735 start_codon:yes stop_codon:yes gene_type:complete